MSIKNIIIEDVYGVNSIEFPIKQFQYANLWFVIIRLFRKDVKLFVKCREEIILS